MTKAKPDEQRETLTSPEDRLQHDIEELESGMGWRGTAKWIAIFGVAAAVVIGVYLTVGKAEPTKTPRMTAKGGMVLDIVEPANGKLSLPPTRFKWEAVAGRSDYTFKLMAKGVPTAIVDRVVRESSVQLGDLETSQLKPGGSYVWEAQARDKEAKILGTARGYFDL